MRDVLLQCCVDCVCCLSANTGYLRKLSNLLEDLGSKKSERISVSIHVINKEAF